MRFAVAGVNANVLPRQMCVQASNVRYSRVGVYHTPTYALASFIRRKIFEQAGRKTDALKTGIKLDFNQA